jgi:hypothetical protein
VFRNKSSKKSLSNKRQQKDYKKLNKRATLNDKNSKILSSKISLRRMLLRKKIQTRKIILIKRNKNLHGLKPLSKFNSQNKNK